MLEWVVIGGGVHGTHLSHVLTTGKGVARDRVCVLDREAEPLAVFWQYTAATGMTHMRSVGVHHLDLHPYSLLDFHKRSRGRHGGFIPPYDRPRLSLFRAHSRHVTEKHGLDALRVMAAATSVERTPSGFRVETSRGPLQTRRVVLALGASDEIAIPTWAPTPDWHVFHPAFSTTHLAAGQRVAIIGGGISAAQVALDLNRRGLQVSIIARHAPREHQFDSDAGWLGPRHMAAFAASPLHERRAQIDRARHRGSIPRDLTRALRRAARAGTIDWLEGEIARVTADASFELELTESRRSLRVDQVVLATGFARRRPGGALVDRLIDDLGLPCSACGFPLPRDTLEWAPGLYVTGSLAELRLGPSARNIAGARAAGERLMQSTCNNS